MHKARGTDTDVGSSRPTERTAELRRSTLRMTLFRYGGVVALVALATLARFALRPVFGTHEVFATYLLAVVFSAWLAGLAGGLISVVLSCLAAAYFFSPQDVTLLPGLEEQVSLLIFVLAGIALSIISDSQQRIWRQAEKAARAARQHELSLAASEKRYQAILDSTTDGLMVADMTGYIVASNPAAAQLLSFADPKEMCIHRGELAKHFTVYDLDGRQLPDEDWPLSRALRSERFSNYEVRVRRPDNGAEMYASYSGTAVLDSDGRPQFAVVTLRDITELKEAQMSLARAFEREALLNRVEQAIRSSLNDGEIETVTAQTLGQGLGADRCFFVSLDRARGLLTVESDWCRGDLASLSGDYPMDDGQAEYLCTVFTRAGTLRLNDTDPLAVRPEWAGLIGKSGCRSLMMVPLFAGKELIAFLAVAMATECRNWNLEEAVLAQAVAAQSRSAVQSVRLQQKEHRIATMLQEALQPRLPSQVGGLDLADHYTAALDEASVGGDFYDIFDIEPGLWALVVGDVSGKGLPAAAQVAMVRNMLRSVLYQGRYLADALTMLNKILTEHDLLSGFVTLFVAVYREQTGTILHASCGHEPALLYQAATGEVVALEAVGPPLGVDAKAVYHDCPIRLMPGDTLFIYTDGVSEAGPARTQMLGTPGVAAMFQEVAGAGSDIGVVRQEIIRRVQEYAGGPLNDDVCLLLARRQLPAEQHTVSPAANEG